MLLLSTVAAFTLLAGTTTLEAQAPVDGVTAQAEKNARTRCMMRQVHVPAGRGVGASESNCHRVAKAEVAATAQRQALANTENTSVERRD